jgi:membrane-bound lytic murein transglycosylase D
MIKRWMILLLASVAMLGNAEEDTPVLFTDMPTNDPMAPKSGSHPWQPPDFSNQPMALGYNAETFAVPKGMEERVTFWKEIYTRYTTDQGVLHDSLYPHLVYEPIDFGDIMKDDSLSLKQKERARRKRVDAMKKTVRQRLIHLQEIAKTANAATPPESLTSDEKRYWDMFIRVDGDHKFKEASVEGRLRFQLGQSNRFVQGIYQSGRYLSQMEQIFREEGVPVELTRLPFVESSFNLKARSRVGASGIWQFMRSSAKPYMRVNATVDERNDPLHATHAAATKMRFNFRMLETWPLAVTAYNRGPSGVKRLVDQNHTKNLAELLDVRKGRFGFASANFYASFLAALDVERNALTYFGLIYRMPDMKGGEVVLRKPVSAQKILDVFDGNLDLAKDYNPHILDRVWRHKSTLNPRDFVRVPLEKYDQMLAALSSS